MLQEQKWIWQSKVYPNFFYNEKDFQPILNDIQENNDKLNFIVSNNELNTIYLDFEINSLTNEIINSSDIEGETLRRKSVRESLRKKLDRKFDFLKDKHTTRQSDNYANILLDTNLNKNPLSIERLHGWHNCLFEGGYSSLYKINVASFRTDEMQVVSGGIGKEYVHYEAVLAKDICKNMQSFLDFCNTNTTNAYIKSAIAHLWFVIIHPYDDGNGRIARAIADFLLPNNNIKLYSLSKEINSRKKEYYTILEKTNKFNESCDISQWIKWHLNITNLALKNTLKELNRLIFKTKFWDIFKDNNLNKNQQKFLNKILDIGIDSFQGNLNIDKYASIAKVDLNTATKEFNELCNLGCLIKNDDFKFTLRSDISKIGDIITKQHRPANQSK